MMVEMVMLILRLSFLCIKLLDERPCVCVSVFVSATCDVKEYLPLEGQEITRMRREEIEETSD